MRRAWLTAGHGELWNCDSTYCSVPYEDLPKIDVSDDGFQWLDDVSPELRSLIEDTTTLDVDENELESLDYIVGQSRDQGLDLPVHLLTFLRSADLQAKVPTCTGCYVGLSDALIPFGGAGEQFLLRVINDSQHCVMWYLCLERGQYPWMLASSYFFEPDIFRLMEYEGVEYEELPSMAFRCADSFGEFLYRFWVENTIWYSLHQDLPMTPIQAAYRSQVRNKL